ncbi:MAG: MmgE/PrpD family protein [Chloroflexota bacterium]|nr:MmgE/PrpD family protein [Chloroflexota bacterium]
MSDSRNLLEQIVDYAINLRYQDIPAEAVELAKLIVFDSIGTGLGGYQREFGSKALRYAESLMAGDEATLLGSGQRVSIEGAAFANGVMIKILGMDDSHRSAGHIASQVVPAVLAVGEACDSAGEEMIVAIVAAYDFAVRVGRLVRPVQRERGLDLKGTLGAISSALAVARCARLDRETMINCVALAADLASGTEQYVYEGGLCDTKDLIAGFAARNAVFALRLAQSGFYGPRGALDGEYGFFRAFGDGFEPDLFADLGRNFAILGTGFKPHGGCRHTHQAIDAAQAILQDGPLDISAIESIELGTYGYATRPVFRVDPNPPSREVAGLSIRVSTGVALQRGSAWPHDFNSWDDPEVRRLRNLIDVQIDSEIEADYPRLNGCRLRVTLDTGEVRQAYLPNMKGEPEFRMSRDEMREKFAVLTRDLFADGQVDQIYQRCMNLESAGNITQLLQLCAAGETVPA